MADLSWQPVSDQRGRVLRAQTLARIRGFFAERGVLEVETPLAYPAPASDPHLDCFRLAAPDGAELLPARYLQSSPEYAMKRLLAAGSGPIYQICKAFRHGESGRFHHHEFTMLEWYRPGFGYQRLMDEVAELVRAVLPFAVVYQRCSYRQLFLERLGLDAATATDQQLLGSLEQGGVGLAADSGEWQRDALLDLLLSQVILSAAPLAEGLFLYDFPPSQAALARIREDQPPVAERFELYLGDVELANGFHELADAEEQRRRFQADQRKREAMGKSAPPLDHPLLAALRHGLPDCSGVALGLDRLLMIAGGATHIRQVLNFP